MSRIARAVAALLLVLVGLGAAGCIHTWTQTYEDFPPDRYLEPHQHYDQPSDG
jgi:hypothetical protein